MDHAKHWGNRIYACSFWYKIQQYFLQSFSDSWSIMVEVVEGGTKRNAENSILKVLLRISMSKAKDLTSVAKGLEFEPCSFHPLPEDPG